MKKIIIPKDELVIAYNELQQKKLVAEKFGVCESVIHKLFNEYSIPYKIFPKRLLADISKSEIESLYIDKTLTLEETASELGISVTGLRSIMKFYEIQIDRLSQFSLTDEEFAVIVGSALGDGYLNEFSGLEISHSEKQLDYLLYKQTLLSRLIKGSGGIGSLHKRKYKNDVYSYRLRTFGNTNITKIRDVFYRGKTKIIPKNIASLVSPLSLAIWYMDDGGKRGKTRGRIATCCFSIEEVTTLNTMLNEKFNIQSVITTEGKYNTISFPSRNRAFKKFCDIISPYVPECMTYKLIP